MPNQWKLDLSEYGISDAATQELRYFCLRYREMKHRLADLRNPLRAMNYDGMPHGNSVGEPTASAGEAAAEVSGSIEMIEQSAIEADADTYQWLLDAVTNGLAFGHERAKGFPFEEKRFYRGRREMFRLLAIKKKII